MKISLPRSAERSALKSAAQRATRLIAVLAIAVSLSGYACLCAAESSGTLSGTLKHPFGGPLKKAAIRIQHWDSEHPILRDDGLFFTDDEGRYSIKLADNVYDIFIAYPGMSPIAKEIRIQAGKNTVFSPKIHYDRLTKFIF